MNINIGETITKIFGISSNNIQINGKNYSGSNIVISNGKVTIDGQLQADSFTGDIQINISGNVEKVETSTGDVQCESAGSVNTSTGDVKANEIAGNVKTSTGDVTAKMIHGSVKTSTGDISKSFL